MEFRFHNVSGAARGAASSAKSGAIVRATRATAFTTSLLPTEVATEVPRRSPWRICCRAYGVDLTKRIHELRSEWREVSQRYPVLMRSLLIGSAIVAVFSIAVPLWYLTRLQADLPDNDAIARIGEMDQATTVYDGHDQLAFTIFNQRRMDASLSSVSPHLIHAIIAIEDQRFYDHGGLDVLRTASAALSNLRESRAAQGGSTITQQLARQSFLKPDKTIRRKLQELILASRIEAKYSKGEILELYLNKVYFGDGLYGVEAASQGYFGKRAADCR